MLTNNNNYAQMFYTSNYLYGELIDFYFELFVFILIRDNALSQEIISNVRTASRGKNKNGLVVE